jgi:prevent-host-death family protein
MEPTKVTATELRLKTRDLIERVKFKGEHLLIENFGRPMVVIISCEDYERVKGVLDAPRRSYGSALTRKRHERNIRKRNESQV